MRAENSLDFRIPISELMQPQGVPEKTQQEGD